MVNLNINWKFVVIGIVSVVLLYLILTNVGLKSIGGFLGFLIGGVITGYLVNRNFKNGAVHGLLAGFLGGIIISFMALALTIFDPPTNLNIIRLIEGAIVILLFFASVSGIISAIGGVIGVFVKSKNIN